MRQRQWSCKAVRCDDIYQVLSRDSGIAVRCNACEGWFQARMKESKEVNARYPLSANFVSPPRDGLRVGSLVLRCGQGQLGCISSRLMEIY